MPISNTQLKEFFLVLLAKGLIDLFPKIKLIEGVVSDYGFQYDFFLPDKFDKQSLKLTEEKLLLLIHEQKEVEQVSMLKENALNFLTHYKQPLLAKKIDAKYSSGVILFYRFDTILQPLTIENKEATISDLKFFKLMNVIEFPNQIYRITGAVYPDRSSLKDFLKSYANYSEKYHLDLAKNLSYLAEIKNSHIWINKGLELLNIIYNESYENRDSILFFKENLSTEEDLVKQVCSLKESFPEKTIFGYQGQLEKEPKDFNYRGLWRSKYYYTERLFYFKNKNDFHEQLISSLQFIVRKDIISTSELCWIIPISNDLPTKHRKKQEKLTSALVEALQACNYPYKFEINAKAFVEPRAYLTYTDILGKSWKGPFVGLNDFDSNEDRIVTQSLYGSLDRYIAHLLEKTNGGLPFSLAPEQIRLIVKGDENLPYANEISATLIKNGLRVKIDRTDEKLGVRIHAAEIEKTPYIAVIGKNEHLHQMMTIRNFLGQNDLQLSVKDFLQELCNKGHIKKDIVPFDYEI